MSANVVADYLLRKVDADAGDTISNLKLQKLLYYCQGWHMAVFGMPVFPEAIEAWEHGPVVPVVYHRFRHFGAMSIMPDLVCTDPDRDLSAESRELLDQVWQVYGQEFAWSLRNRTHRERPWRSAWEKGQNTPLDLKEMADFFRKEQRRRSKLGELPEEDRDWAESVAVG